MLSIKKLIKRIIYREKASSEDLIKFYKAKGISIGKNCYFHSPRNIKIDITQPHLIKIGDNVQITDGVSILCHDYAWSVFQNLYGDIVGSNAPVSIGNNVFIGEKSLILKGVSIGDNVIIGAGSVVNKSIPSNSVAVGNPCKIVMSIDEYYKRRKKLYVEEARNLAKLYYSRTGVIPPKDMFRDFFPIFYKYKDGDVLPKQWQYVIRKGGKDISEFLKKNDPLYPNYEAFIKSSIQNNL